MAAVTGKAIDLKALYENTRLDTCVVKMSFDTTAAPLLGAVGTGAVYKMFEIPKNTIIRDIFVNVKTAAGLASVLEFNSYLIENEDGTATTGETAIADSSAMNALSGNIAESILSGDSFLTMDEDHYLGFTIATQDLDDAIFDVIVTMEKIVLTPGDGIYLATAGSSGGATQL